MPACDGHRTSGHICITAERPAAAASRHVAVRLHWGETR
ncbi:MAG: hypothetical protein ACJARS_002804 [bacterium]|jgi:hypothetical protein